MAHLWVEVDNYAMDYTASTDYHLTARASCRDKR